MKCFFSLKNNKSPGPDGYNAYFYKKAWSVIGEDTTKAIKEFFSIGHLLKEINVTYLALIPKVQNPNCMRDFRPIACCNTIYKVISKLLANKLKPVLLYLLDKCQIAFIKDKRLKDSVLLAQELMKGYHISSNSPRCTLKVDLRKAYDTIRAYITSPGFSVSINGELHGFFKGTRGLRQELSGLFPNLSKSLLFTASVPEDIQQLMTNLCGFEVGNLPIRYLGRLQLIKSILVNMIGFWCSLTILPKMVINQLNTVLRNFLWTGVELKASRAQVAWWNVCSWNWKMLLHLRDLARPFIKHVVGDGKDVSIWHDYWLPLGPLDTRVDHNLIACSQWEDWAKVQCFIRHEQWRIPTLFKEIIPSIGTTEQLPILNAGSHDSVTWTFSLTGSFHLATTYRALISLSPTILWHSVIWFSNHIPRYSFIAWVALTHKLKTRDSPALAKKIVPNYCSLCLADAKSHQHLYFKCSFASEVWMLFQNLCGIYVGDSNLYDITNWIVSMWKNGTKAPDAYVYKLCLTTTVYFIWNERNRRHAMNQVASVASVTKLIYTDVRIRLMSCKLRDSKAARSIAAAWSLPSSVFCEGQ
ncbi:uncharacterized protein LOC132281568 [Cornus florida]|uniref:uncharacterized protein LOC132281568 n=1 Tax=Cornus florida TaxID=4283 RepID=UPI002899EA99|nr:uncharacterized protein LOC132281568 [Cornus florida]